jgi:hypothetical protein
MADKQKGCVATAAGPVIEENLEQTKPAAAKEETRMGVTVGMKAPDFEATAFVDGDFSNIKLSDYAGKWVTLCFYPGDFTFV